MWCSAFVLNHSFDALQSKYIASIAILRRQRSTFASNTTATAAIGTENARNMTNSGRLPSLHLAPARHYEPRSKAPSLPIPISAEDARASEHFASAASLHARASDAALRDYLCGNRIAIDATSLSPRRLDGMEARNQTHWLNSHPQATMSCGVGSAHLSSRTTATRRGPRPQAARPRRRPSRST